MRVSGWKGGVLENQIGYPWPFTKVGPTLFKTKKGAYNLFGRSTHKKIHFLIKLYRLNIVKMLN